MDADTPTVTANSPRWADIGLSYIQLHRWTSWGYLRCVGDPTPGSGHARRWPEIEIAVAARMLCLIENGLTVRAAAKRARALLSLVAVA